MMEKIILIAVVTGVIGLVAVIVGGVMFPVFGNLVHRKIEKSVPLVNGSESYSNWLEPSVPVYMQFWVFDVLNPDDIVKNRSKPVVEQRGPYTYREIRDKFDVKFSDGDTKIKYKQSKMYVFEPSLSAGNETDNFTSVNLPILTAAQMAQRHFFSALALKIVINHYHEHLFETHTVEEYLWGYEEKTFKAINDLLPLKIFPDDKFGLFYGDSGNGTDDGEYLINTGNDDISAINVIDTWKGSPNVTFWKNEYCNMINGTDGTIFHPFMEKDEILYIFSSDICRSIYLKYVKEYKLKGINVYRFSPPLEVFGDIDENPDNVGFCIPDKTGCLKSGVMNVSPCKKDAPIVLSQPHFYQGAEEYINAIEGINPSPEHATNIDVEPNTGVAMNLAKKLQINAMITQLSAFDDTQMFVNKTIFPIIWLNESAAIGSEDADKFRSAVLKPMKILDIVKIGLIAFGGVLLLISIILAAVYIINKKKDSDVPLLNPGDLSGDQ